MTPGTYSVVMTVTNQIGMADPTPAICTIIVKPSGGGKATAVSRQGAD